MANITRAGSYLLTNLKPTLHRISELGYLLEVLVGLFAAAHYDGGDSRLLTYELNSAQW